MSNLINFITEEEVYCLNKGDKILFNPTNEKDDGFDEFTRTLNGQDTIFGLGVGKEYTFKSSKRDGVTENLLLKVEERNSSGIYFKYFGKVI